MDKLKNTLISLALSKRDQCIEDLKDRIEDMDRIDKECPQDMEDVILLQRCLRFTIAEVFLQIMYGKDIDNYE